MKLITTVLAVLSLFVVYSPPATAQDEDCWHYEDGDAPIVGSVDTPGDSNDVAISDSYAYVVDGDLQVIDIEDPTSPQLIGSVNTSSPARNVAIEGGYAYVVSGWVNSGTLNVIDITEPTNPKIVGIVDTSAPVPPQGVSVSGSYAYVASGIACHGGFEVIDISIPTSPQIVGSIVIGRNLRGLVVVGNYAYVSGYEVGLVDDGYLLVIDISDPQNPVVITQLDLGLGLGYDSGLTVSDNYLFVAVWGDLRIFDISDPGNPWLVGSLDTPGLTECVAVEGSFAYLGEYDGGLQVVDISVPESPAAIGWMDLPETSSGIEVDESFVYIASAAAGLHIAWQQCPLPTSIEGDPEEPETDDEVPVAYPSLAVHPNPFNPQTTISFSLERDEWATVSVFELTGRRVALLADRTFDAGTHSLTWSGRNVDGHAMPSGTYIVRLETEAGLEARKVMLLR